MTDGPSQSNLPTAFELLESVAGRILAIPYLLVRSIRSRRAAPAPVSTSARPRAVAASRPLG